MLVIVSFILSVFWHQNIEINNPEKGNSPKVLHILIDAAIDPRTNRYSELAMQYAVDNQFDYVILELDTYGGALNDADDIRTRILDFTIPIFAFINKDAASAGALISIACDSIYMAAGSSIGAATVVTGDGKAAPDKYQSYMRSIMRATAEAKGRDPKIAEGMVDEDIDLDSISNEGKVITLSVSEAIKLGFCEAKVADIDEIMKRNGVENFTTKKYELGTTEKVISFFLNPFISGILIMIILGGIWFELQTPGIGFALGAAILALILYLTPYYLNGLAANWEIVLFFLGLVLIVLEILIFPGFGVAGVVGISALIVSLILIMLNNDIFDFSFVHSTDILIATLTTLAGMGTSVVLLLFLGYKLTFTKAFKRISLHHTLDTDAGYTSSTYKKNHLVGKKGMSYTILRPSGKIIIEDKIYDAYTRGHFIEANQPIEVLSDEGTSLIVRKIQG